ncbi:MAG: cobalamin-dependent protein [candidate division KSB1 bacterium]|nr:cobalamin-dependent protein [candidate division KSB1 bacterium]
MKVLLIQPPIEDFYTTPIRLYPLGLLYAAATLRRLGCSVELLDALSPLKRRQLPIPPIMGYLQPFLEENPLLFKGYYRFGLSDEEIEERVRRSQPDLIGISTQFTAYFSTAERLIRRLLRLNLPIVLGGHHATVFQSEIHRRLPELEAVLSGPAETALPAFFSRRFGGSEDGVDWKSLTPAHDLAPAADYRIGKKPYISLTASRGCPFACEFCSVQAMFGRRFDKRPVEDVVLEMTDAVQSKGVQIINFEDDNLSVERAWFAELLQRIIAEPALRHVELTAMNGLCYPTLNNELLRLMYLAGFRRLNLSFVTRDPLLRQRLSRPMQKDDLRGIVEMAKKLGFMVTVYVIIGLPDQTFTEIKQTIDDLLEMGVLVGPSVFYIPPGSSLYNNLEIPQEIMNEWDLYRSSAFAVETNHLSRRQLVELFTYVRAENLRRRQCGTAAA